MGNTGNGIVLLIFGVILFAILIGMEIIELPEVKPATQTAPTEPFDWTGVYIGLIAFPLGIFLLTGIRIIRPVERSAVETFGKYSRFQASGLTYIIPIVQKLYRVNITEQLVDIQSQETITKDNLNAKVDAQVYYKVRADEENLKKALYSVNRYDIQIVQLARTTLRNVIGQESFKEVNSNRSKLNESVFKEIKKEADNWGIEIIRVELKEIEPPKDVQDTMNRVIKAENTKDAEKDFATARETQADGVRRSTIKRAEGDKQAQILRADGEKVATIKVAEGVAKQIQLVNTSAQKFFRKEAIVLKHLEVTESALKNNTKWVLTEKGLKPTIVMNETDSKIIPTAQEFKRTAEEEKQLEDYIPSTSESIKKKSKGQSKYTDDVNLEKSLDNLFG